MTTKPSGWLAKVQDHEGDPLARYMKVRVSDPEEAAVTVAQQVPEKHVHLERNLTDSEVVGMRPGEVVAFGS
jgi:hypothetical protein